MTFKLEQFDEYLLPDMQTMQECFAEDETLVWRGAVETMHSFLSDDAQGDAVWVDQAPEHFIIN